VAPANNPIVTEGRERVKLPAWPLDPGPEGWGINITLHNIHYTKKRYDPTQQKGKMSSSKSLFGLSAGWPFCCAKELEEVLRGDVTQLL
jgi:hypothetical protein